MEWLCVIKLLALYRWRGGVYHWAVVCQQPRCHGRAGQPQEAEGVPLQGEPTREHTPTQMQASESHKSLVKSSYWVTQGYTCCRFLRMLESW